MTASPNLSHRVRKEIDEAYTFPIKYSHLSYDIENSAVLVNYQDDGAVTVILKDPPGRQGYHLNYPDATEDDPSRQAKHDLANELVEYAETLLAEFDPKTSHWKSDSGNWSLRDIYVEVDEEDVDAAVAKMWQVLVEFKPKYIAYLEEHDPDKLVSTTASLEEKVNAITGGLDQPFDHDSD